MGVQRAQTLIDFMPMTVMAETVAHISYGKEKSLPHRTGRGRLQITEFPSPRGNVRRGCGHGRGDETKGGLGFPVLPAECEQFRSSVQDLMVTGIAVGVRRQPEEDGLARQMSTTGTDSDSWRFPRISTVKQR